MYPPTDYVMILFDVGVPPIAFSAPNYLIFGFFPSEKQCCFSSFLFFLYFFLQGQMLQSYIP